MVNLGVFAATVAVLVSMGRVLDALGGFTFDAFRADWLVQYPFWAFTVIGVLITRPTVRPRHLPDATTDRGEVLTHGGFPQRANVELFIRAPP